MFSKRCFSDSSPRLATEENPFRGTKNACRHQCFEAFWCLLPLQILTTLCTHHSEKHRLENTVCYSLAPVLPPLSPSSLLSLSCACACVPACMLACLPGVRASRDKFPRNFPAKFIRGRQKAPENATHPKTQKIDHSENLRFRVCCVFGCSLFPSKRAPKHTRKRNTPENADFWSGQFSAFSGVLRFRVLFGACQVQKFTDRLLQERRDTLFLSCAIYITGEPWK